MIKNILITGSSGFIGQNLQKYLKPFYKLETLSIRYFPYQKFDLVEDVIIHLGGKVHDLKKFSKPSEYYDANFELTKQLFNSFLDSGSSVFIFMSTVKAAADSVEYILDEEFIPNPKTTYGKSKLAAENYILNHKLPIGKRIYILRPCMIHGPGNKGNLNTLFDFVKKGIPYPFGRFENKRSFVSVDNLCFIVNEIILNKNIKSGIYNIADDEAISTNELVSLIGKIINKNIILLKLPKFLVILTVKLGDLFSFPVNSETLKKLTENYEVSNLKIKKAINKKLPLALEKGLEKTITSFNL
jgi:nucleoside-diphosphate-sugar epimerase